MLAVYPARGCRDKRARVVLFLALVLHDQGDLQGARTLHERALRIYEAYLGPDHPATVRSHERLTAALTRLENPE
jgi:hypothetical protein